MAIKKKCSKDEKNLKTMAAQISKQSKLDIVEVQIALKGLIELCAEEIAIELVDAEDIELITWGDSVSLGVLDAHISKLAAKKLRAK